MDMLAFLHDSTDDDDDDECDNIISVSEIATAKKTIHPLSSTTTATACESATRRSKIRRRGCIDVISSSKARDSEIFARSVPHRRGHWAGHVKIPFLTKVSSCHDHDLVQERKKNNVKTFQDLLERRGISGKLVEHEHLHLSLSKEFSLQDAQIESFVRQLTNFVRQEHATSLYIDSMLTSEFRSIWDNGRIEEIVLLNEEKTRSFLCWKVRPNVTLRRIVAHIDSVMKSYKQPVYYEPAKFHISIASFPGNLLEKFDAVNKEVPNNHICIFGKSENADQSQFPTSSQCTYGSYVIRGALNSGNADEEIEEEESSSYLFPVRELKCTVGTTKEYTIPLRDS